MRAPRLEVALGAPVVRESERLLRTLSRAQNLRTDDAAARSSEAPAQRKHQVFPPQGAFGHITMSRMRSDNYEVVFVTQESRSRVSQDL